MIHLYEVSKIVKLVETENSMVVARASGKEKWGRGIRGCFPGSVILHLHLPFALCFRFMI